MVAYDGQRRAFGDAPDKRERLAAHRQTAVTRQLGRSVGATRHG